MGFKRVGTPPAQRCSSDVNCPDVFTRKDEVAFIGEAIDPEEVLPLFSPEDRESVRQRLALGFRMVTLPRDVMRDAVSDPNF